VHTRLDRLIEVIDQLVDEQLARGESRDEYDYGCICIGERDACRTGCIQGHPRVTSLSLRVIADTLRGIDAWFDERGEICCGSW
jgi:hypothetical protein